MLTTTTNEILKHEPCPMGWHKLTGQRPWGAWIGTDDVLTIQDIIERNGLEDAFWAVRAFVEDSALDERIIKLARLIYEFKQTLIDKDLFGANDTVMYTKINKQLFESLAPLVFIYHSANKICDHFIEAEHGIIIALFTNLLFQFVNEDVQC